MGRVPDPRLVIRPQRRAGLALCLRGIDCGAYRAALSGLWNPRTLTLCQNVSKHKAHCACRWRYKCVRVIDERVDGIHGYEQGVLRYGGNGGIIAIDKVRRSVLSLPRRSFSAPVTIESEGFQKKPLRSCTAATAARMFEPKGNHLFGLALMAPG